MKKIIFGAGLAVALAACQTVSTNDQRTVNTPFPDSAPPLMVVRDFETAAVVLKRDAREGDWASRITQNIGADLLQGFRGADHETQRLASWQQAGGHGWVVTGRLRLVQWSVEESAADDDRIECTVYVYDVSKSRTQPFLTFEVAAPRLAGDAADGAPAMDSEASLKATCEMVSQIIVQRVRDYVEKNF